MQLCLSCLSLPFCARAVAVALFVAAVAPALSWVLASPKPVWKVGGVFLNESPPYLLRHSVSLNLELTDST